ncbi:MAG: NADH-quinone oxidoreductase subunit A [Candidatus Omnitrophota bacterium]
MMTAEYLGIFMLLLLAAIVSAGMILVHQFLGKRVPTPEKEEPFECGKTQLKKPCGPFSVKFYLVAILFILFDIEIVFLFPWAVLYRSLGLFGLLEMAGFLLVLAVGLVYAWKKGALEWEK